MKIWNRIFPAALMFTLCTAAAWAAPEAKPLTAAVLDFESSGEKLKGLGTDAAQLLGVQLSGSPSVILVERQELDKLLGEIELGQGGAVTPESAAKVGQMLGAQALITGRIFQAGGSYYMVAKVMGVETSRVYGESSTFKDTGELGAAVESLGKKIDLLIREKGGTLVAKVESQEEFVARLKEMIKGKNLPVLGVSVSEQHFGRQVPDPAVQTEFLRFYQMLGGKTSADPKDAKVWVTGEAFSERGMQKGNLVACRARVEITVKKDGQTIASDRQTSAALGLGEMVSGKEALEKAARILLERNLAKIAAE